MAWTYSAYEEEPTDAARLTMLRQHITEVTDQISADVSSDGHSRQVGSLQAYLATLQERRRELEELSLDGNRKPTRTLTDFGARN